MQVFARYRQSLAPASRVLLDRYEIKDAAHKVVGVGSVGTSCWVLLLTDAEGESSHTPRSRRLVLQFWRTMPGRASIRITENASSTVTGSCSR